MGCGNSSSASAKDDTTKKAYHEMSEEEKAKIKKELEESDKKLKDNTKKEDPAAAAAWKFDKIKELPVEATDEARKKRLALWNKINEYGNGYVSYKRLDVQITKYLGMPLSIREKGPIRLAFNGACNRYAKKGANANDGLLEWMEFRIFLVYLRQYFEYYAIFTKIDTSGDNKISLEEFKKAIPTMKNYNVKIEEKDAEKVFKSIDKDKSGSISFKEFCTYAIEKSLNLEDDSFDDEELKNLK